MTKYTTYAFVSMEVVQYGNSVLVAGMNAYMHLGYITDLDRGYRYTSNEGRPDIVVYDSTSGSSVNLDVALDHPWSSEGLSRSVDEGVASSKREEKKQKNDKMAVPCGSHSSCVLGHRALRKMGFGC